MSIVKTWYTVEEAMAKFGAGRDEIMAFVDQGLVRAETEGTQVIRVNADDLTLILGEHFSGTA